MTEQSLTIQQQAEQALAFAETRTKLLALAAESARITEITNSAGYQECHARRMVLKSTRIEIQKTGKDARDEAVKYQKAVIAKEKELVDLIEPEERRLQELQDAVDQAKDREKQAKEQAERDRIAAINARFVEIRGFPLKAVNVSSDEIRSVIDEAEAIDTDSFPDDMKPAAIYEKRLAVTALRAALDRRVDEEAEAEKIKAERAELERLRAEREGVQAEADRLAKAERDRIAEAERVERDREAAERAERQRQEDEERRHQQARLDAERQELERQKAAAVQAERDAAIANASLLSAANEAVNLLRKLGHGEHIVTKKLEAAIGREPEQKAA